MLTILRFIGYRLFRLLFQVEYHGLEYVPQSGPAILAGNHPSYLDPALVVLPLKRTVRYMAWDALFRIPILGQIIRHLGAFPVDIRKGRGESAYQEAKQILLNGEVLGIFPEGQRSEQGPMGELKTGTARLAIDTGAPVIPITIGGAARAWPKYRLLPKPAKIVVRFHPPLQPDPAEVAARRDDRAFQQEIMESVAGQINRSLQPALRGDAAWERWYRQPPSNLRTYEWVPLVAAIVATVLAQAGHALTANLQGIWVPVVVYYLYLLADLTLIRQSRLAKWMRNSLPVWLMIFWHPSLVRAIAVQEGACNALLVAGVLACFFLFFYENYLSLQKFVRGLVTTWYLALLLQLHWPQATGVMTSMFLFQSLFCIWFRIGFHWLIAGLSLLSLFGVWMLTGLFGLTLLLYTILPVVVILYLNTFINAAYDIRLSGEMKEGSE